MPKRNDDKFVSDDEEDDDREDPVAIRDSCGEDEDEDEDDEEANEDLSLKILEKALSRRDFDDSKESSMSDLCGSGVVGSVMVNGGKSKGNKKMKRTNLEAANEIVSMNDSLRFKTLVFDLQFVICLGMFDACV